MPTEVAPLNPYQQRRLRATCQYIDGLLSEIEAILDPRDRHPLFPRYAPDLPQSQRAEIARAIVQIRGRMSQALSDNNIVLEPPSVVASQAIRSTLNFIDIAVTELRPRHMRGYGAMPPKVAAEMECTADQLEQLVRNLDAQIGRSQNLAPREPTRHD